VGRGGLRGCSERERAEGKSEPAEFISHGYSMTKFNFTSMKHYASHLSLVDLYGIYRIVSFLVVLNPIGDASLATLSPAAIDESKLPPSQIFYPGTEFKEPGG
jgi:hypothetical protein